MNEPAPTTLGAERGRSRVGQRVSAPTDVPLASNGHALARIDQKVIPAYAAANLWNRRICVTNAANALEAYARAPAEESASRPA